MWSLTLCLPVAVLWTVCFFSPSHLHTRTYSLTNSCKDPHSPSHSITLFRSHTLVKIHGTTHSLSSISNSIKLFTQSYTTHSLSHLHSLWYNVQWIDNNYKQYLRYSQSFYREMRRCFCHRLTYNYLHFIPAKAKVGSRKHGSRIKPSKIRIRLFQKNWIWIRSKSNVKINPIQNCPNKNNF